MRALARGAARRGLQASAILLLAGQAVALASYAASGWAYRPWTWVKVGLGMVLSVCGVGIEARAGFVLSQEGDPAVVVLRYPLLVGTILAVWLVFRAAERSSEGVAGDGAGGSLATAAAVALGFAAPIWALSWLVSLRFPGLEVSLTPVRWEAAVWPLLLGLGAALAGVLRARVRGDGAARPGEVRLFAWVAGGWRMLVGTLVTMFGLFLLAAATHPAAIQGYATGLRAHGGGGLAVALLHLAALPAQSFDLLVPAMGGVTLAGVPGADLARMTLTGIRAIDPGGAFGPEAAPAVLGLRLPIGFGLAGVLLPLGVAVGTVVGGVRAAAAAQGRGSLRRAAAGGGAGVVFAVLVAVTAHLSAATFVLPSFGFAVIAVRTALPGAVLLALCWGVLGGVAGAVAAPWLERLRRDQGADEGPEPPFPPSPTSA